MASGPMPASQSAISTLPQRSCRKRSRATLLKPSFSKAHKESGGLLYFKVKAALADLSWVTDLTSEFWCSRSNQHIGERSAASVHDCARDLARGLDRILSLRARSAQHEKEDRQEGEEIESESTGLVLDHLNAVALRG